MSIPVARLDDVCEINPRVPKTLSDDAVVSFLPMAAVSENGMVDFEESREVREVKKGYTYFERGDVLVAKITPCFENGKATRTISLTNPIGFGSTEFHVLRAGQEIDSSYLFHLIWNSKFRKVGAENMTGSAGQKRVPADFLKRLEIPLPPLDEQRRIAAILDKADALRRKRKHSRTLLDRLNQSIFQNIFGNLADHKRIAFGSALAAPLRNGLSPAKAGTFPGRVLTLSAITGQRFKSGAAKTAMFEYEPPAHQRVEKGMFLICRGNGNKALVGLGVFAPLTMNDTAFPDTMIVGHVDETKFDSYYFQYVWNSGLVRNQIERSARTTNGTFKVNQQTLEAIDIPMPGLDFQREYGAQVSLIRAEMAQYDDQLIKFEDLFSSLQHRAFSGQL